MVNQKTGKVILQQAVKPIFDGNTITVAQNAIADEQAIKDFREVQDSLVEQILSGDVKISRKMTAELNAMQTSLLRSDMNNGAETETDGRMFELRDEGRYNAEYEKPITAADVETLRTIGRKSINDFTSEDIKKAQKWAYNFYRELGTKSPFFRAWFGDWRAYDRTLLEIAAIPKYEATNDARKQQRGAVTNDDTKWDIRISREGETNTISHSGAQRLSEFGLAGIKDLVSNAVLLDSEIHKHHNNNAKNDLIAFDHKFYALGQTSVGINLYKITIEEIFQDPKHTNEKRFHNLKYIEKIAEVPADANAEYYRKDGSTMGSSTKFNYRIADLYSFVKQYDVEFTAGKPVHRLLRNKYGTPKVFYHGSPYLFDTFDRSKAPEASIFTETLGYGNYFAVSKEAAEKYSKRNAKTGYVYEILQQFF